MKHGGQEPAVTPASEILEQTITGLLAQKIRARPSKIAYRALGGDGWNDVTFDA